MLGIPAISTGDIMRAEIKAGSALGERVKSFTTTGKLVPDEIVTAVVRERLKQTDATGGYILVWFAEIARPHTATTVPHITLKSQRMTSYCYFSF